MKKETPLISIIMPIYNTEQYLEKSLNSLIMQTYDNLEIICIDDGSKDNSLEILNDYSKKDSRIKILTQQNSGQSVARNKGLDVATGDWLTFVDSDDWVSLSLYQKFVKILNNSNEFFDTYMFNYTAVLEKPKLDMYLNLGFSIEKWGNPRKNNVYKFFECRSPFSGNMSICNKIYSVNLIRNNNIMFEKNKIFEDKLFYFQTLLNSKGIYINNDVQYFYRQAEGSTMHTISKNGFDVFYITEKIEQMLKEKGVYNNYQYALFQYKYRDYAGILVKIEEQYREEFYIKAIEDLKSTVNQPCFDMNIGKRMQNSQLYFDMIQLKYNEFINKYTQKHK